MYVVSAGGALLEALSSGVKNMKLIKALIVEETDLAYDLAVRKVEQSARFNPLTWAGRKLILSGVKTQKTAYEIKKQNFLTELGV